MVLLSVHDVAARLGINAQRVRALAARGQLPASKVASRWLFDSELLHDYEVRGRAGGRPFSEVHALGLLFLASGEDPVWVPDYDKWRLRRYVSRLLDVLPRLRARAKSRCLIAPKSLLSRIERDPNVVRSGVSGADVYRADIVARGVVEVYCLDKYLDQLAYRYALREAPQAAANLIAHGLEDAQPLKGRAVMPLAVVACDLAESSDERTRRAGRRLLEKVLDADPA